jgi:hypothetical protein
MVYKELNRDELKEKFTYGFIVSKTGQISPEEAFNLNFTDRYLELFLGRCKQTMPIEEGYLIFYGGDKLACYEFIGCKLTKLTSSEE